MNPKFVKILQYLFFLLVGLVLLFYAFKDIDLHELMSQIFEADYRWVALSLVFAVFALIFRAFRWRLLIEPLEKSPKLIHIFHAINIGYLANFAFPRIGEITRCGILNRTDRVSVGGLFGTVIVERIFDMLMAALMLCLILLLQFDVVGSFIMEHIMLPIMNSISGMIGFVWLIAIFALATMAVLAGYIIFRKQLSKITAIRKIKNVIQSVLKGIQSAYRMKNFGLFIILNLLIFAMYFLQTYVLFFALESSSSLRLVDGLFILVISSLALIIPVQGGIGAYHLIISMGLTIFGLTREEGMVYATISHSATSILFILLGIIGLIFVFFGKKSAEENDAEKHIFRKMGYYDDQSGIIRRYQRERVHWDAHLTNTRQFALEAMQGKNKKSAAVLGSGWLLDVPVEEMSRYFEKLFLFDVRHPATVQKQIKRINNVELRICDISGFALPVFQYAKQYRNNKERPPISDIQPQTSLDLSGFDFVFSCNILNQLDILLMDYLAQFFNLEYEETVLFRNNVQQHHIDMLPRNRSCLVADYEEITRAPDGKEISRKPSVRLPIVQCPNASRWTWTFDTKMTYYKDRMTFFEVLGCGI